jgi:hypothetical protein
VPQWALLISDIDVAVKSAWNEEPNDIRDIRLGVIRSGTGTGKQSFSVLVHLKTYLMAYSADMLFRVLKLAADETITATQLKTISRALMFDSFKHFHFMCNLGLQTLSTLGTRYDSALASITNKSEFIQLTSALVIYINLLHRWIHAVFPWELGVDFLHRTEKEVANKPKISFYDQQA